MIGCPGARVGLVRRPVFPAHLDGSYPPPTPIARPRASTHAVMVAPAEASGRQELTLIAEPLAVTSAVRHGARGGTGPVTDERPALVPRPGAMATDENGGFGLFIIEQLARRWGMTRENRRTRVWFEFDD